MIFHPDKALCRLEVSVRFSKLTTAVLFAFLVHAQTDRGMITGVIIDPSGAAVAGAVVTATNQQTNVTTETVTTDTGAYRVVGLPVGDYILTVQAKGFQTHRRASVPIQVS